MAKDAVNMTSDKPNRRERVGVALNTKNMKMCFRELTAADFVAALGGAEEIGRRLWEAKYGAMPHSFNRAHELLVDKLWRRHGKTRHEFVLLCRIALRDWMTDACYDCKGIGAVGGRDVMTTQRVKCPNCFGKGGEGAFAGLFGKSFARTCPRCCGNKMINETVLTPGTKTRACLSCGGTGQFVKQDADIVREMKLKGRPAKNQRGNLTPAESPMEEFQRLYANKYRAAIRFLQRLDSRVDKAVKQEIS